MEKTNRPLTSVELVSMKVLDAKGRLVGTVKDVFFQAGKSESSLSVEGKDGKIQIIEWNSIQGASDFIVLKPVGQSAHELRAKQKTSQTVPQQQSSLKNPFRVGIGRRAPESQESTEKASEQKTSQTVPQQQSSEKSRFRVGIGRRAPESQESNSARPQESDKQTCPKCGGPLTWIPQKKKWYCFKDKKYVEFRD